LPIAYKKTTNAQGRKQELEKFEHFCILQARAGWERKESLVSRGDSMVAGAISFVFVLS
jgi:hypothetical protein